MRLKNMYFICRNNYDTICGIDYKEIKTNNSDRNDFVLENYKIVKNAIESLSLVPILSDFTNILIDFDRQNNFYIKQFELEKFKDTVAKIKTRMEVIIELGDSVGFEACEDGFDVKLPDNMSFDELSTCISDLNMVFNQCPYLNTEDSRIKFKNVDVGSEWLTFMTVCTGATVLLTSLAYIVDKAVKIASHVVSTRQQLEQFKALGVKNEVAKSMADGFKEVQNKLIEQCIAELNEEISPVDDNEASIRVRMTLDILSNWMTKGLQIYSAIESPNEIKDLFPTAEKQTSLLKGVELLAEHLVNEEAE